MKYLVLVTVFFMTYKLCIETAAMVINATFTCGSPQIHNPLTPNITLLIVCWGKVTTKWPCRYMTIKQSSNKGLDSMLSLSIKKSKVTNCWGGIM